MEIRSYGSRKGRTSKKERERKVIIVYTHRARERKRMGKLKHKDMEERETLGSNGRRGN